MKTCSTCKQPKPLDDFAKDKLRKDGHTHNCKSCRSSIYKKWCADNPEKVKETRDRYWSYRKDYYQQPEQVRKYRVRWLKKYGLSIEEYEKMLDAQRNVCYVCNRPEPQERCKHLSVDHNHTTGKVRKLLCSNCNRAIGLLREDIELIEKIKQYLIEHESHSTISPK